MSSIRPQMLAYLTSILSQWWNDPNTTCQVVSNVFLGFSQIYIHLTRLLVLSWNVIYFWQSLEGKGLYLVSPVSKLLCKEVVFYSSDLVSRNLSNHIGKKTFISQSSSYKTCLPRQCELCFIRFFEFLVFIKMQTKVQNVVGHWNG